MVLCFGQSWIHERFQTFDNISSYGGVPMEPTQESAMQIQKKKHAKMLSSFHQPNRTQYFPACLELPPELT